MTAKRGFPRHRYHTRCTQELYTVFFMTVVFFLWINSLGNGDWNIWKLKRTLKHYCYDCLGSYVSWRAGRSLGNMSDIPSIEIRSDFSFLWQLCYQCGSQSSPWKFVFRAYLYVRPNYDFFLKKKKWFPLFHLERFADQKTIWFFYMENPRSYEKFTITINDIK